MIDVHLISNPNNPPEWETIAINSLPSWITLHIIPQENNSVGFNRHKGFNIGNEKYVSFVDGDDIVKPLAFEKCLDFLEKNPDADAVSTMEDVIKVDGTLVTPPIDTVYTSWMIESDIKIKTAKLHHLLVFRRTSLLPYLDALLKVSKCNEKYLLNVMASAGCNLILLPFIGYTWRIHNNGVHFKWGNAN